MRVLHSLQVELFEWSWQFQQQEALRRKDEVMASIRTYIGVLNNEWEAFRQLALNWRNISIEAALQDLEAAIKANMEERGI